MRRRDFLKKLTAAATLAGSGLALPRLAGAAAANDTVLVVVFQRGGCDGLNHCVPHGDGDYYALRPGIGISKTEVLDLDGFFGLHPAMAPLVPIYQAGELAMMPAVHYPQASRSHFDSQQYIESGNTQSEMNGWLNRFLTQDGSLAPLPGAAFGNSLPHALRGDFPAATLASLGGGLNLPNGFDAQLRAGLQQLYTQSVPNGQSNRQLLHDSGVTALEVLAAGAGLDPNNYAPEYGAVYPSSGFGRQMAQAAQLIKAGLGTRVITIDIGGWDTHSSQGGAQGAQASRLADLAGGMAALHQDMSGHRQQVAILSMTEFGRTAKENGSGGTDHGNAGCWMVAGNVNGGIYGDWPGLSSTDLYKGRYLAHNIDYRDIMGEILLHHLGASDVAPLLPGHSLTAVGFL